MAKKKSSPKRKKKKSSGTSLTKRINSMAKKKTIRRKKSPARRKTTRKKTRGIALRDSGSRKPTWGKSFMGSLAGSGGGLAYALPQMAFSMPWWAKALYGLGGATVAHKFGFNNVGSGVSGAMSFDLFKSKSPIPLKDDFDLQDTDWVDADTLSDSGFELSDGTPVLIDTNGDMYAMNDDGDMEYLGDAMDLQDEFSLADNLNSVSLVPLSEGDPYSEADYI